MKWLAALVVVAPLAACEQPPDPHPINPSGGGGTGTSTKPDAAVFNDAALMVTGRVCLLSAPQKLTGCDATGAGDITVQLGTASTTTAIDGTFTLMRDAAAPGTDWIVSALDLKTSVIKFGTTTTLPSITNVNYDLMVTSLQATLTAGQGALMTRITHTGAAVAGATVVTLPASDSATYYDGPDLTSWQLEQTGPNGVAWVPSLQTGTAQLTVTSNAKQTSFAGHLVLEDAITFVLAEIP